MVAHIWYKTRLAGDKALRGAFQPNLDGAGPPAPNKTQLPNARKPPATSTPRSPMDSMPWSAGSELVIHALMLSVVEP